MSPRATLQPAAGTAASRWRALLTLCLALLLAPAVHARLERDELPRNAPENCPYCHGDPALMAAAGVVSHGGFEFGATDTAAIDAAYPTADIRWIESAHLEIGLAVGARKIGSGERKRVIAELERLAAVLPEVNPKTRSLDAWLLTHLYAQRLEDAYARFSTIIGADELTFPDGKTLWNLRGGYLGEGPYLGQKGKYEQIVWPSQPVHTAFLEEQFGLRIQISQRWNVIPRDTLLTSIPISEGNLREDPVLHNHLVFTLTHNLLDGFRHYSYDIPIWLHVGLSHWMERSVDPRFNSFDSSEGAVAKKSRKSDWNAQTRKLLSQGKLPRMAELMALRNYAEVELPDNFAAWSRIAFLLEQHPEAVACLLHRIKGRMDKSGHPDGGNLGDVHRKALQECLGWSYVQFDEAWAAWAGAAGR